jgi:hypothetical protein
MSESNSSQSLHYCESCDAAIKGAPVPYQNLDPEMVDLVRALNTVPGMRTLDSCFGHPGSGDPNKEHHSHAYVGMTYTGHDLKVQFLNGAGFQGANASVPVPENLLKDFYYFLDYRVFKDNPLSKRPRAVNNKARITAWMSFWPYSLVGTLLNDPVRRLFNAIFSWVKGLYQKMADAMFSKDVELK